MNYRLFHESEDKSYFVTDKGEFYSIDEATGKRYDLEIQLSNNIPFVKAYEGKRNVYFYCKSTVAKYFTKGFKKGDRIIQINGDPYDCSVENLRNMSLEKRNRPCKPKKEYLYKIEHLSYELGVSTSAVQEIKGKLKIKGKVTEEDYNKMSKFVDDVKRLYKKVTLSTINNYLYYQGVKLEEE